jgi:hypothetical protein
VVCGVAAEHPRRRAEGVGHAAPHDPFREVPVGPGLPAQDPGSSTRESPCTRCAATCTSPTGAPSAKSTWSSRPSRRGA